MATIATRIGPADHGRAMTLDEFLEAEEEGGYRYELSRGVLEVTQVPNPPHGQVVCNLYQTIGNYRLTHPGVIIRFGGGGEFQLVLPGLVSGRNPDLSVVLRGAPKGHQGHPLPALVAEVVSARSGDRDYRLKREEYLAYGILEYWIVDLPARKVTVLVRDGDVWAERVFEKDQVIVSLVLPGLAATVAELWADVDANHDEPEE